MTWLSIIPKFLGALVEGLKALFLVDYGKKTERLKQKLEELEKQDEANKRNNAIDQLPDSDLDDLV
tara:strand:+ start:671 stop:868 length:198 start_codon:yes stop_codon:yes gene_type:complete